MDRIFVSSRPSLVDTLLEIAFTVAQRGTCSRAKNGAVIADSRGVILSTGYNGSLAGFPHCDHECDCSADLMEMINNPFQVNLHENSCPAHPNNGCQIAVHAEANAVYFAARNGVSVEGQNIYCTMEPCTKCAEAIIQSGISKVYYRLQYRDHSGLELLRKAGIEVVNENL